MRRCSEFNMEKSRKKSIPEKLSELQMRIKKLNEKRAQASGKKAASIKDDPLGNSVDRFSEGDPKFSPGDEMIININYLDLSNEETWLYMPEKSSKDEAFKGTAAEANQENGNQKISCA